MPDLQPVVGIFTHQNESGLSADELRSLQQCHEVLGSHPLKLIHPEGLDITGLLKRAPKLEPFPIPPHHLSSLRAYNRLKVTPWLYQQFKEYDYFLTYELDAWVFRDELLDWCSKGYDYIGAPWFKGHYRGNPDAPYLGVGNSGFSLRKITSVLKVFESNQNLVPLKEFTQQWWKEGKFSPRYWRWWIQRFGSKNKFRNGNHDFPDNEDVFWGSLVPSRLPWFQVAPIEAAKHFAFELYPRRMYNEIGQLPFGCHKYRRNDPDFWAEHGID